MLTRIQSPAALKLAPSPNYDTPRGKRSQLIVVHDVEAPLTQGYADSLARGWFGHTSAGVSAHYILGPSYALQMVDEDARAWHCGPAGNIISIGIEQAGYAHYSRAQWLTADGRRQIKVLADLMSDISKRRSGPASPTRASNSQIQAYSRGGSLPGGVMWCTHHQITQSLGGTTHTDPDPNYPYDVLQADLDSFTHEAPRAPSGSYTVRRGDTLGAIADAHNTTVPALVRANGIKNPNVIHIGQVLKLSGTAPAPKPKPKPKPKPYTAPPGRFPLAAGNYFGSISGPAQSHGGYYASERKYVRWIQIRLHELGYAPGGSWADGRYGPPTVNAVAAWQRARHRSTTSRPGEVYADDYRNLETDR